MTSTASIEADMANYTLGCCDASGAPCGHSYQMGERKNRVFNPIGNPKYASLYDAPVEVQHYDKSDELTYLRFGCQYSLTDEDKKTVKKIAKKGGHKLKDAEAYGINYDTILVEVAARTRNGDVVSARYFGDDSKYNRTGVPDLRKSYVGSICGSIDIGCQHIKEIVEKKKYITKVIFMTSCQDVINIATNIWDYQKDGFPTLPTGFHTEDALMLHHNFKFLEEVNGGIEVMLWKVNQEYLSGAVFDVNCRFDDLTNVPNTHTWDPVNSVAVPRVGCVCGNCIVLKQRLEVRFAATGKSCNDCDCAASRNFDAKYGHLKAGDQIPLTNNIDKDIKLTMKVDANLLDKLATADTESRGKLVASWDFDFRLKLISLMNAKQRDMMLATMDNQSRVKLLAASEARWCVKLSDA